MGYFLGDPKGAPISSGRMTLLWSPESIHDLLALRAHINEHDPAAAKRVALHILYCVEYLLAENPKLGVPGRVPGTRELVIPKTPYIVPYRVSEYVEHYHAERNHQGKSNVLLFRRVSADGCEVAAGRATYAKTDALLTTMTAGELASQLP